MSKGVIKIEKTITSIGNVLYIPENRAIIGIVIFGLGLGLGLGLIASSNIKNNNVID